VSAEKLKDPARLSNFVISVDARIGLDAEHVSGLEVAVHHCLIHNTLLHPPTISIEIHSAALVL
jgi:hypothetical protein